MERQDQIQYFQQQLQQVVVLVTDTIMLTQLQEMVVLVQVHQVVHLELDRLVIPLQQLPHKVMMVAVLARELVVLLVVAAALAE
jgi:hypothetical protein